jgi:hypothetical protein
MAIRAVGTEAMSARWKCSRCSRVKLYLVEEPIVLSDSPFDANAAPTRVVTVCVECLQARWRRQGFCELCGALPHRVLGVDGDACRVCGLVHQDEEPSRPGGWNVSPLSFFELE